MSTPSFSEPINSPSEVSSRSVSPSVPRPAVMSTPQLKQRSSSMNSVNSSYSTHQRSMSIVSSESPRNSIVSVDDFFLKPTRNNSCTSLASPGVDRSPLEPGKDGISFSSRLPRSKAKSASAIVSDEEYSEPEHIMTRSTAWRRRRSSDKVQKPDFFLSFKNNFKFKYDSYAKPKTHASALGSSSSSSKVEDPIPSPLSSAVEGPSHHTSPVFNSLENESLPPSRVPVTPTTKKVRSSSMTQSMFLKRKLLLSKDIQLELHSGHASTTAAYPSSNSTNTNAATSTSTHINSQEIRCPSHFLSHPAPSRSTHHHGYLPNHHGFLPHHHSYLLHHHLGESSHHVGDAPQSHSSSTATTLITDQPVHKSPSPPQGHPSLHSFSNSSFSSPSSLLASPPTEQTLRQQNKLITELNRKWNRAMYSPSLDDFAPHDANSLDFAPGRIPRSKKRGRSESASSTDSLATNFS